MPFILRMVRYIHARIELLFLSLLFISPFFLLFLFCPFKTARPFHLLEGASFWPDLKKKRERNKEKNAPVDAFEAIIEPRFGIFVHVFRFFGLERREQRESVRDREKFLVLFLGETKPRGRKKRSKNPWDRHAGTDESFIGQTSGDGFDLYRWRVRQHFVFNRTLSRNEFDIEILFRYQGDDKLPVRKRAFIAEISRGTRFEKISNRGGEMHRV